MCDCSTLVQRAHCSWAVSEEFSSSVLAFLFFLSSLLFFLFPFAIWREALSALIIASLSLTTMSFSLVQLPEALPSLLLDDLTQALSTRNALFGSRSAYQTWMTNCVEEWLRSDEKVYHHSDMKLSIPLFYHQRRVILEWLTLATGRDHLKDCSNLPAALEAFLTISLLCLSAEIPEAELELVRWSHRYKGSVSIP